MLLINNPIVDQRKILLTHVCYSRMKKRCSSKNLCVCVVANLCNKYLQLNFSYRTQIFAQITATNLFLSCTFFYIAFDA